VARKSRDAVRMDCVPGTQFESSLLHHPAKYSYSGSVSFHTFPSFQRLRQWIRNPETGLARYVEADFILFAGVVGEGAPALMRL
jgi:hypothetical protein